MIFILIILIVFFILCLVALFSIFMLTGMISRDEDIKAFQRDASKGGHRVNP
jgi:hypothetical protein